MWADGHGCCRLGAGGTREGPGCSVERLVLVVVRGQPHSPHGAGGVTLGRQQQTTWRDRARSWGFKFIYSYGRRVHRPRCPSLPRQTNGKRETDLVGWRRESWLLWVGVVSDPLLGIEKVGGGSLTPLSSAGKEEDSIIWLLCLKSQDNESARIK